MSRFRQMRESDERGVSDQSSKWKCSIICCLVSLVSVVFTQFTLSLLPVFLPTSSFLTLLPLSVVLLVIVVGVGRLCKRVAGMRASAPAFVFFSIIFVWAVYIYVVRQVISSLVEIAFNIEIITLIIGLYCIMSMDPGFVNRQDKCDQSSLGKVEAQQEESPAEEVFTAHRRARYCRHCKNYVMGFDHHCPAFGNCIGQRNHFLFIVLLAGFVICEATFVVCASQFSIQIIIVFLIFVAPVTAKSQTLNQVGREAATFSNLVLSTTLFCLIQVLWQVVFVMWHLYCACFNIKTDEWINWKKYSEFQIKIISDGGQAQSSPKFMNPYDKGIVRNLKEFMMSKA